jgi:large conductance mechanosensitive channel
MKKFFNEFKAFISRGNVIDMAVGVIIGGAFQAIIKSLVDDVIMPVLSVITGGTDFSEWKLVLVEAASEEIPEVALNYGNFINAIINFLLMAIVIFIFIKILNTLTGKLKPKKTSIV